MTNTSPLQITTILQSLQNFFATHQTKSLDFRIQHLKKLKQTIHTYEQQIANALWQDLHKSYEEVYLTEISIVKREIDHHIKHLKKWSAPRKVPTPLYLQPSSSRIINEPLGVALIMAPWNYPFQLLFTPLIGAISAGCCAILKPSELTPKIAEVMALIIQVTFNENYIAVVQGDYTVGEQLLQHRFDVIFFTGSTRVGKIVMQAAANYLTPVILELGGKSPCIVDASANIDIAANRIAWGKAINAGQTCIAPDYLLVHHSVKEQLIAKIGNAITSMYGADLRASRYYPRIVNEQAFDRLTKLMQEGNIRLGGATDMATRFIAPTIIEDVQPQDPIMKEEIFGPLLPVITFSQLNEALTFINSQEKPLALYYFGKEDGATKTLSETTSGGACINDTLVHIGNHYMPFGGVGGSGLGKYHGKDSYLAFSNQRAIVTTPTWIDLPFKYAPFKHFNWIKKLL